LAALTAAGAAAFVTGVTSGNMGMALKAGLIAGVTAFAFNVVGDITSNMPGAIPGLDGSHGSFVPFSEGHLANIAGHALVGCASAVESGSTCQSGALSAGVSSAAGPLIDGKSFSVASLAANSVLGGLASIAGGGKFANGAITAAFGYLFNAAFKNWIESLFRQSGGHHWGPFAGRRAGSVVMSGDARKGVCWGHHGAGE